MSGGKGMIINLQEYRAKKKRKQLERADEHRRFQIRMQELAMKTLGDYLSHGKRLAKILPFRRRKSDE